MNEIVAFITALSHATNIAKAAIDARDDAKRREALAELTSAFADLQVKHLTIIQNHQTLLNENESLRTKLDKYDKWEQEKTRYLLRKVNVGTFVRALNPDKAGHEPLHWLCTHCYEERKKGFLQRYGEEFSHYKCDWKIPKWSRSTEMLQAISPA